MLKESMSLKDSKIGYKGEYGGGKGRGDMF